MTDPSPWTLETLRIYLEALIHALSRKLDERHHAQQASADLMAGALRQIAQETSAFVSRAEADAIHGRFSTNFTDVWAAVRGCIPRAEYDAAHTRLVEQLDALSQRMDKAEGRSAGIGAGWGYLIAIIAVVSGIISIYAVINHL